MKHVDVIEGEVLPPERPRGAPVVFSPSPFKPGTTKHITLPYGVTVLEAVRACGVGVNLMRAIAVYIGDQRVDRSVWHVVRPKPGVPMYVRVELQGGGKGGKNPLRAILMLAVVAFAAFAAPALAASMTGNIIGSLGITSLSTAKLIYTAAHVLAYAGIAAAGAALVNAVAPPPKPPAQQYGFDQQPGNPYASITGLRNQMAPYAMIPRVFGKRRMFPMLAARPYTESQGNTQFLRMLLLVGYGPIKISDLRIGNTPITAIANAQYEIREGWGTDQPVSLFSRNITEQSLSSLLSPSTPVVQTTVANTTEISVDITFPNGLANFNANTGARQNRSVIVTVQWSNNGGASWNNAVWIEGNAAFGTGTNGQITCTDASAQTVVRSGRFSVPAAGTYQVRLNRTTAAGGQYDVDTTYWSVLRSIRADAPVKMSGLALIALRLQATAQLSGIPDAINCIAESYLPTYDGSTWSAPVITRNPAWAFAHALRFRGAEQVTPDSRIDLAAIKSWADACDATAPNAAEPRWRYDEVVESGSIWTVAQQIASHARARFAVVDGKYSIVRDVQQTVPVQHISPRNSRGYRGSKAFVDLPHAFRVKFPNDAKDNVEDEVIVYRDGYNADGSSGNIAATKFEQLPLPGCTSPTQAWREGRYHMATLLLRPEEHVVDMDFEHLRCTVGDLVRFSHDVVSIGLGQGRISARTVNVSSQVVSYDLDNPVEMVVGTTYGIRVRRSDGTSVVHVLTTTAGLVSTVTLATPVALSGAGDVGDHFQFGVSNLETAPMIVKRIDPGPDFTATLTLVDAQSGVYSADTGTIPAFSSYITNQIAAEVAQPLAPSITLRSDESAILRLLDGTLMDRIIVTRAPPAPSAVPIGSWEMQMRRNGANGTDWQQIGIYNADVPGVAIDNVIAGLAYDVRARTISTGGVASDWAVVSNHVVVGKTTVPASLTGLAVARYLDGNLITWNLSPEIDVVEYEIRVGGTDWASATFLAIGVTNAYFDARTSFGSLTYRVRARDAIGLLSPEASITANPSAPVLGAAQVAGFIGQGALATQNSAAWGSQVSGRPGNLAALSGSEGINNALVPVGVNGVANSDFTYGDTYIPLGWGGGGTNAGVGATYSLNIANGKRSLKTVLTGSPGSGFYFDAAYSHGGGSAEGYQRYAVPVNPGDVVGASWLLARNASVSDAYANIAFYNSSYAYITEVGSTVRPTTATNGDSNDPANYTLSTIVATAPAGARFAITYPRALTNGGAAPTLWAMEPMLARLAPGQTTVPPYAPTPADRRADVTAANTASAIAGQGPWATTGTALATVLAPRANFFPYPRPINATAAPSTYGWQGGIGAANYPNIGGLIYYKSRASGAAVTESYYYDLTVSAGANTFSFGAGATNATVSAFVDFYTPGYGSGVSGGSAVFDATTQRYIISATAPSGYTIARLVINGIYPSSGSFSEVFFYDVKAEAAASYSPGGTEALIPRQGGADVTASNTASAIAGQGDLATTNRAALPFGANAIVDDEFRFGDGTYWRVYPEVTSGSMGATHSVIAGNGFRYIWVQSTGVGTGHLVWDNFQSRIAVKPGDRIQASCMFGRDNLAGAVQLYIIWRNAVGAYVGDTLLEQSSVPWAGGSSDLSGLGQISGVGVAPAGVYTAQIYVRGLSATNASGRLGVTRPMIGYAAPGQTAASPWSPGLDAERGANVTETRTAAAVTGQGTLATRSNVGAAEIITGSVTVTAAQFNSGSMTVTTSYTTAATIAITAEAGDVIDLAISATWALISSNTFPAVVGTWRIVRNGSTVVYEVDALEGKWSASDGDSFGGYGLTAANILDTPGAGSHTYTLEVYRVGGFGGAISKRYLRGVRLRR